MDYLIGQTFSIIAVTAFVFFCFGYSISYLFEKTKFKESGFADSFPESGGYIQDKEEYRTKVEVKEVVKEL